LLSCSPEEKKNSRGQVTDCWTKRQTQASVHSRWVPFA